MKTMVKGMVQGLTITTVTLCVGALTGCQSTVMKKPASVIGQKKIILPPPAVKLGSFEGDASSPSKSSSATQESTSSGSSLVASEVSEGELPIVGTVPVSADQVDVAADVEAADTVDVSESETDSVVTGEVAVVSSKPVPVVEATPDVDPPAEEPEVEEPEVDVVETEDAPSSSGLRNEDLPLATTYPLGTFSDVTSEGGETTQSQPLTVVEALPAPGPTTTIVGPVVVVEPQLGPAPEPAPEDVATAPSKPIDPPKEPAATNGADPLKTLLTGFQKKLKRHEKKVAAAGGDESKMQSLHTQIALDNATFTRNWYSKSRTVQVDDDTMEGYTKQFRSLSDRSEALLANFK